MLGESPEKVEPVKTSAWMIVGMLAGAATVAVTNVVTGGYANSPSTWLLAGASGVALGESARRQVSLMGTNRPAIIQGPKRTRDVCALRPQRGCGGKRTREQEGYACDFHGLWFLVLLWKDCEEAVLLGELKGT